MNGNMFELALKYHIDQAKQASFDYEIDRHIRIAREILDSFKFEKGTNYGQYSAEVCRIERDLIRRGYE